MEFAMVCTCGIEGVREVEARRLRIFKHFGLSDMGELTTAIVLSLAFDFKAHVCVYADMWFGVELTTPSVYGRLYIQCDHPGDGLAVLWEHLVGKFPGRAAIKGAASPAVVRVTERVSAALLEKYEVADKVYQEHREGAHAGPNDCPPCEDCAVCTSLRSAAHQTLDRAWGADVLDAAIEKAFEE
jgi:hypothetical protein